MEKLLGIAMCGGESRRMGTDKGLVALNNITWAQNAANKLSALGLRVVVSINPSQCKNYSALFATEELVTDAVDVNGPLNGILSVHAQHPKADLLLLACDMIDMKQATLQNLVNTYRSNPGFDFYAYHNGNFFEPLCALYTANALFKLMQKVNDGSLTNVSLQSVLKQGNVKVIEVTDADSFINTNSY